MKNLGQKGQVKEVSEGYFGNFLQPRKLAIPATDKQLAHVLAQKEKSTEKLEAMEESARSVKSKIDGKTVLIKEKAGEAGRLYRAVNEKILVEAIEQQLGAAIPPQSLKGVGHFKNIGEYTLNIPLYKSVSATINLKIETE